MNTFSPKNATVLSKEIRHIESSIKYCYERLELLEDALRNHGMDENQRNDIEMELREMRKRLNTNEEILTKLNNRSQPVIYLVGAAFGLAIFLVWMLYVLVNGRDN